MLKFIFLELVVINCMRQGHEIFKSDFLQLISSTSGAKARKDLNQIAWNLFCRLLEPRPLEPMPKNVHIAPPGAHFVDIWSQGACSKIPTNA